MSATKMSTRGVKPAIPEELKKHTHEEQRLAQEKKKHKADTAKAQKKAEQDSKRSKGAKRIAALEDNLPKVSQQSIASILASQTAAVVPPSLLAGSASTAPSDDGSPSPSPIPSPQFDLAPALDNADHVEDGTDGDDLPPVHGMHTSESEGTTDEFGASEGNEGWVVSEDTAMMDVLDDDPDTSADESSDEYKLSDVSASEASASEPEIDMESLKQLQEFLKLQKANAIKSSKKKGSTKKTNGDAAQRKAGDGNGRIAVDAKGKKKKMAAECKDERLDVHCAIVAEHKEAPKAAVEPRPDVASMTAKKWKDSGDLRSVESQKHPKTELRGLAKDWHSVLIHADLIATSSVDRIEMPAEARVKSESVTKKMATKELVKDADVQEIDVKEHGKKSNWKNKDLPFENFVRDLPIWQQKFVPSLVDWATSNIKEPFGTTNHQDFKATVQDLWAKTFSHLSLKLKDNSARAEHPAIHAVAAAAVRTHRSDIGKEALKVMEWNWEHEDMKGCLTDEDQSKWVKEQLNGSRFLYKNPDENVHVPISPHTLLMLTQENRGAFRGRLIMETFAFHLQVTMNAPHHYGNPIAGLAVTASAVLNNPNSFKDDPWGSVVNKYFVHLVGYNNNKWRDIVLESAKYLNIKKNNMVKESQHVWQQYGNMIDKAWCEGSANQMPVGHQLAIALFQFGHYENAASVESIVQWAGVSAGMVINATRCVMIAFLALHDDVICWPSAKEKEAAKKRVEAASCAA
ncbi:hypothetical protein ARMGADRAFT_1039168 [Armillaria gallica]|uniref:Uncharacterized protein n=1 Tax=Armillaria gallica TaxID=47427 RepID=A0A2H3CZX9_ARMGA|nr:hypothetical protein ARMGADRAFT_1039168 [Armillaria gallica]